MSTKHQVRHGFRECSGAFGGVRWEIASPISLPPEDAPSDARPRHDSAVTPRLESERLTPNATKRPRLPWGDGAAVFKSGVCEFPIADRAHGHALLLHLLSGALPSGSAVPNGVDRVPYGGHQFLAGVR